MPKLSQEVWDQRRQHVLESAWRCFARSGFHATSMDDVVAESGWSSSVVYRFVRGKDKLIESAGTEAFRVLHSLTDELCSRDPVPTPREVVRAVVDVLDDERHGRAYSLAGLVIHTWAEAFTDPAVAARGQAAWATTRSEYAVLARRWRDSGLLPEGLPPADVAAALALVVPAVMVDGTFLGGRGTAGLLKVLRATERVPVR